MGQMANKHTKRGPTSLAIREMQNKVTMTYSYTGNNFKLADNKQGQGCSSMLEYFRKTSKNR